MKEIEALATVTHAILTYKSFTEARNIYPDNIDNKEAIKIHQKLITEISTAFKYEPWKTLQLTFNPPHYENTDIPSEILLIMASGILMLGKNLGLKTDNLSEILANDPLIIQNSFKYASKTVQECRLRIDEILTFDCKIPHSPINPEFQEIERYFFMLNIYWNLYMELLIQYGSAEIGYSPHPLLRFIINLKYRIEFYLKKFGKPELSTSIMDVFEIQFDQDSANVWNEWAQPKIANACITLEEVKLGIISKHYDLTNAENFFIELVKLELIEYKNRVKKNFTNMVRNLEKRMPKAENNKKPISCFEYIGMVEKELRKYIKEKYQENFEEKLVNEIKNIIGKESYQKAEDTMHQRNVKELKEIIYYLQLKDLYQLISQKWQLFSNIFSGKLKDFNKLMAPILKGRTEEAHNRPEHLWPEIEKHRVSVACHDLLKMFGENDQDTKK